MDDETVQLLSLLFDLRTRRFTSRDEMRMHSCGVMNLGSAIISIQRSPVPANTSMTAACRKALPPEEIAFATAEAIR